MALPPPERVSDLNHEPDAILYARTSAGLSQADAARQLDISAGFLSHLERGYRSVTPALLKRMASVYNCPRVVLERKNRWADADADVVA